MSHEGNECHHTTSVEDSVLQRRPAFSAPPPCSTSSSSRSTNGKKRGQGAGVGSEGSDCAQGDNLTSYATLEVNNRQKS